jgi:hypothetical protein
MPILNPIRKITHSQIYFGLMMAMAATLPMSKALMSIFTGALMAHWLIEGRFQVKFQRLKERKSVILLISIFFVYLIGLLWTISWEWGVHDLKIQLPLLMLPLVIGTSEELNYSQIKKIVYFFSAAVVFASICSIWVLLGFSSKTINDPRQMSLFISHIRFALLINISIFSLGWYLLNQEKKGWTEKSFLILTMVWLSIFLVILKSATGWVVFLIALAFVMVTAILKIKKPIWRTALIGILFLILVLPACYIGYIVHQFYDVETLPKDILHETSKKGNSYYHELDNKQLENGHYVFLFISGDELREAWNKRSRISYDSTTSSGFNHYVLFRYLTSKGYRKDAEGLSKLSDDDIRNIENGMTNYRFVNSGSFYNRIYQVIWEIDVYQKGVDPSGHSVTQRIEYYKMAASIIAENFWFGTGTGGYYQAYQDKYDQSTFFHDPKFRQRSHNMFLSYWIDFGIIGLIYICFAMFYPIILERKTRSFLLKVFILILLISFMNEDTLNNHDAITFFSFFYPLYLFSRHETPELNS